MLIWRVVEQSLASPADCSLLCCRSQGEGTCRTATLKEKGRRNLSLSVKDTPAKEGSDGASGVFLNAELGQECRIRVIGSRWPSWCRQPERCSLAAGWLTAVWSASVLSGSTSGTCAASRTSYETSGAAVFGLGSRIRPYVHSPRRMEPKKEHVAAAQSAAPSGVVRSSRSPSRRR